MASNPQKYNTRTNEGYNISNNPSVVLQNTKLNIVETQNE